MQQADTWDLGDADVTVWQEMMAELADRDGAEPFLLVADDGDALVRLSLLDRAGMPLGISGLVGSDLFPLAAGDVAEALVRRGWVAPVGGAGGFRITTEAGAPRSAGGTRGGRAPAHRADGGEPVRRVPRNIGPTPVMVGFVAVSRPGSA